MAKPLCEYFGVCGGCSLQDLDYPSQVEAKRRELSKATGLDDVKAFFGGEYHYRTRMDFAFHRGGLGFRRKGSWREFFDARECVIANDGVNGILAELRGFFKEVDAFDPSSGEGTFRYAIIRAPAGCASVSFVLNKDSPRLGEAAGRVAEFASSSSVGNVSVAYVPRTSDASLSGDYNVVKGGTTLRESYLGKSFGYHIQGFFQNNHEVAEMMHGHCRGLLSAHDTSGAHLLDLYGGVGTFGGLNADLFKSVTVAESDTGCVEAAKENMRENGAENAVCVALDARHLKSLDLPRPLIVVTDPPRAGMHPKTVKRLNELEPEAVIYVSCNLGQLKADIPRFEGYELRGAALFDMFPQTPHSEAVAELVRKE